MALVLAIMVLMRTLIIRLYIISTGLAWKSQSLQSRIVIKKTGGKILKHKVKKLKN